MISKSLMSLKDMFGDTDNLLEIEIEKLDAFSNHPFSLYEGERLQDMIRSIKELGIITPVIVRRKGERFEILSGHNRTNAARLAGLNKIPVVIKENVTDEEAMWIVTETNLVQRSFVDMTHSERALVLYQYHSTLKAQGKRTDLVKEVEALGLEYTTSCQLGQKLLSNELAGEAYHLSGRTVSRYIRVYKLISYLKEKLDKGELPLLGAVNLSYLKNDEQILVGNILKKNNFKVDIKSSKKLRELSKTNECTYETIYYLLQGNSKEDKNNIKFRTIKLKKTIVNQFFCEDTNEKVIEETIEKALKYYFEESK